MPPPPPLRRLAELILYQLYCHALEMPLGRYRSERRISQMRPPRCAYVAQVMLSDHRDEPSRRRLSNSLFPDSGRDTAQEEATSMRERLAPFG
jgi:hypothetical protein